MSDLAGRPLTIITPAAYRAALDTGGAIWVARSRCGRYLVFRARAPLSPYDHARYVERGERVAADVEDLRGYLLAYDTPAAAGAAIVEAWRERTGSVL